MKRLLPILTLALIAGCSTPSMKEENGTTVVGAEFDFNKFVEENLGPVTAVTKPPWCMTWLEFIRGIVKAESNWTPNAKYTEKFIDGFTKRPAISAGYFQLSVGDKLNYKTKYCSRLNETNIVDRETNTGCALEIIERLISRGRSLGAYWSVVRDQKVKCND